MSDHISMGHEDIQEMYTKRALLYQLIFLDVMGGNRKMKKFFEQVGYLKPGARILDVGCGTGNATRALWKIAEQRGYDGVTFHAFDFTQAMLDLFQRWVRKAGALHITLRRADVLRLGELPVDWTGYDLIVSSAMFEYLSEEHVRAALRGLKRLLKPDGILVVFVTKRSWLTRWFIGSWWKAHTYEEQEFLRLFLGVGFRESRVVRRWWRSMFAVEGSNDDGRRPRSR